MRQYSGLHEAIPSQMLTDGHECAWENVYAWNGLNYNSSHAGTEEDSVGICQRTQVTVV